MTLRIFNTLSGQKEEFVPLQPGKVRMYVCGVTVYDYCHVGHARAAIVFDTIFRYFRHLGYDVTYVRNFTDIDDKIIKRAQEENLPWTEITKKYIAAFYEDMDRLNVARPTVEPHATEHIRHMIEIIEGLIAKGKAYPANGDVYYSVRAFPEYGRLSGRSLDEMKAGARVEPGEHKKDPMDFALWKASKPGEPAWDSPWGPGRPGWHIECSAMSHHFLGETFDIHGGGKDLVFPHHENEIAQSCGFTGKPPVRYWMHNGFVNINKEKMSKSLGNFFTIRDILKTFHPEVLRLFLQTNHYRGPIDFADKYLEDAKKMLRRFYDWIDNINDRLGLHSLDDYVKALKENGKLKTGFVKTFDEAMLDDFNTALALGHMNEELTRINRELADSDNKSSLEKEEIYNDSARLYYCGKEVLGIFHSSPKDFKFWHLEDTKLDTEKINELIKQREEARASKDFARADWCRDELKKMGVVVKDTKTGTTWEVQ